MQSEIRANGDEPATVVVERDGEQLTLRPTTVVSAVPDPEDPEAITKAGFLGVVPSTEPPAPGPRLRAVARWPTGTWQTIKAIATLPAKLYHVGRAASGSRSATPTAR